MRAEKFLVIPMHDRERYLAAVWEAVDFQNADEIKIVYVNDKEQTDNPVTECLGKGKAAVTIIHREDTGAVEMNRESVADSYLSLKDFLKQEDCFEDFERPFMNAALFDEISALKNAETDAAYRDILTEIKYYAEDKLHFLDKPATYYYEMDWVKDYVARLRKKPDNSVIINNPKVTVVIPSLNSRQYIRECVESAIEQTLKDIEILCVDAGSTDGTIEVLQEYEKLDHRVKIIHSDKRSYGYQINLGIKAAKGEYFAILESDDYIIPEMYEELYQIAKENSIEVLKADFDVFTGEKGRHEFIFRKIVNHDEQYNKVLDPTEDFELFKNNNVPWSGLYEMAFLRQHRILLNESPGASFQDNGLWFQTLCQAHRLYYVNKSYYRLRRDNPDSSVYSRNKVFCICDEYDFIRDVLRKDKNLEKKFAPLSAFYRNTNYHWRLGRIAEEFKIEFLQRFADDFNKIENNGELDASLFTKPQWDRLHGIMKDPVEYYYSESQLTYEFNRMLPPERYPQELERWFKKVTGKTLDLDNPKTFNEKIQWLKLYDNIPIKTRLADKYQVRGWIREKLGEEYLIPLLGVWDRFEDIDFGKLPKSFVLKANHGSGWNIIVKDKEKFDVAAAKEKFDEWMKANYAIRVELELQYADIVPRIIAEQYIDELDGDIYDYRFFCFNGKPKYVWVDVGSGTKEHKRSIFDLEWNLQDMRVNYPQIEPVPPVPDNFAQMLKTAEELCKGFVFVRVDLYSVKGKIYFGEMTFTPQSGKGKWYPEERNLFYGSLISLPLNSKTRLPEKSFAERGAVPMPEKIVLPKSETELLKDAVSARDGRISGLEKEKKRLEQENTRLRNKLGEIKGSKAFKVGEKIAWPVRKIRNLMK